MQPQTSSAPHASTRQAPAQQDKNLNTSHGNSQNARRYIPLSELIGGGLRGGGLRGGGFTEEDLEELLDHGRRHRDRSTKSGIHKPATRPGHSDEEKARMAAELRSQGVPRFLSMEPWRRLDETLKRMRREKDLE